MTAYNDGLGLGDGGVICNASDLARFPALLYHTDLFISDAMLDEMLTTVDDGEGGQYGLGIGVADSCDGLALYHSGATGGFQSNMLYLVDADVTVVILTNNFDADWLDDMTDDVLSALVGAC